MAVPTFVSEQETALDSTSPKSVGSSISALVDDILVEVAGMEWSTNSTAQTLDTPTGGTSVTRTLQASEDGNSDNTSEARLWTAPITSDQSLTPSFSRTGSAKFVGTALLFRDSDGVGAAASTNNSTGSGAPSLDITTTQDNSAIVVVVADWNAADGASRTWRTVNSITPTSGNGYERTYARDASAMTYYVAYYPDAGAAGTKTVGLSAPSTMRYVICAVEIKGAGTGSSDALLRWFDPEQVEEAWFAPELTLTGWFDREAEYSEESASQGVGAASGTGATALVGKATARSPAAATGTGTLSAAGRSVARGALSASGTGALAAVGGRTTATFSASGVGATALVGRAFARAIEAAAGVGALSAAGRSTSRGALSASGVGTLSAGGRATGRGALSASGLGAMSVAGVAVKKSVLVTAANGAMGPVAKITIRAELSASGTGTMATASPGLSADGFPPPVLTNSYVGART